MQNMLLESWTSVLPNLALAICINHPADVLCARPSAYASSALTHCEGLWGVGYVTRGHYVLMGGSSIRKNEAKCFLREVNFNFYETGLDRLHKLPF